MIFNALIIIALIPLALRGVRYRPVGPTQQLGVLGERRVNVLELNLALDALR